MNGLAKPARPPLSTAPGSQNPKCLLTEPTTLYTVTASGFTPMAGFVARGAFGSSLQKRI